MHKPDIIGHVYDGNDKYEITLEYLNSKNKKESKSSTPSEYKNFLNWKDWLFSPWAPTSVWYEVTRLEDGNWLATYYVAVYDTLDVDICWIGDTPTNAINKLQNIILKLKNGVWD